MTMIVKFDFTFLIYVPIKPGIHLSKNNRAPRRGSLGAPRCANVYGQLRRGKQPRFALAHCATRAVGCWSIKVSTGRGVPHSCAVVFAQVYSRLKVGVDRCGVWCVNPSFASQEIL